MNHPPVKAGHLAYFGGGFRHDVARLGKCRVCDAEFTGPANRKYCDACRRLKKKEDWRSAGQRRPSLRKLRQPFPELNLRSKIA